MPGLPQQVYTPVTLKTHRMSTRVKITPEVDFTRTLIVSSLAAVVKNQMSHKTTRLVN